LIDKPLTFNPPEADEGLPAVHVAWFTRLRRHRRRPGFNSPPLGALQLFPIDTPLLAAG